MVLLLCHHPILLTVEKYKYIIFSNSVYTFDDHGQCIHRLSMPSKFKVQFTSRDKYTQMKYAIGTGFYGVQPEVRKSRYM